jgi:hypothetical protein
MDVRGQTRPSRDTFISPYSCKGHVAVKDHHFANYLQHFFNRLTESWGACQSLFPVFDSSDMMSF